MCSINSASAHQHHCRSIFDSAPCKRRQAWDCRHVVVCQQSCDRERCGPTLSKRYTTTKSSVPRCWKQIHPRMMSTTGGLTKVSLHCFHRVHSKSKPAQESRDWRCRNRCLPEAETKWRQSALFFFFFPRPFYLRFAPTCTKEVSDLEFGSTSNCCCLCEFDANLLWVLPSAWAAV